MNAPFQIRQLAQYPRADAAIPGTVALLQMGEAGTPYASILTRDLVTSALAAGGDFNLAAGKSSLNFLFDQGAGAVTLSVENGELLVTPALRASTVNATFVNTSGVLVNGVSVATLADLAALSFVSSFNLRTGDVMLMPEDILRAGGAPIRDAHFGGWITAPSVWDTRSDDDTVATTNWVHRAIHDTGVSSFNCRTGCVTFTVADFNAATATAPPGVYPTAPSPALGDASSRLATTLFVDESMADLEQRLISELGEPDLSAFAPLNSPDFTGIPLAPTANPGTSTGQIATTAFVQHAVTASTTGVSSFNTRTGAVVLTLADVTGAGGAPLASPALTGVPTAPTAAPSTSTTQIATTAFVTAAISSIGAGVVSFNGRAGAVTLTTADVTGAGGAPIAGPSFTGTVTAPTPAPATNNTQVATTAYVTAAITAAGGGVSSFNSRTGAVTLLNADISAAGGALIASPTFTGVPAAPTAAPGTSTTQLATTAFVAAAISAGVAGVTSFNTRTGAVTLVTADITGAGGAPIASPALTGTPTAPTAVGTSNDTTVATTAFVKAAITASAGVASFNTRTGAVTLNAADVSAAGGALIASPTFTGTPAGPTATPGTSTTQLATTAFVAAALASGVSSFNGRNGAVTLSSADITGAGGALLASPTFTGTPNAPTATAGTNNTQIATTAFVAAALSSGVTPGWTFSLTGGTSSYINATGTFGSAFTVSGSTSASNQTLTFINHATGTIAQIADNSSNNGASNNYLIFKNNLSGQPSIITCAGIGTDHSIQLIPLGAGTVQAPTMPPGTNSTAIATTAFVQAAAVASGVIAVQVFTASGTYTPTAGMKSCIIEAVGGGAGGNGITGVASTYKIGGGGGSGAYARKFATAATIGASQVVTIGAGGAAGTGAGTAGGAGGDTSVGTICVARGAPAPSGGVSVGGTGGPATGTGDYQAIGSQGAHGIQLATAQGFIGGGAGGSSMLGQGAGQTVWSGTNQTGNSGQGYGGGGGGGSIGTTGGVAGGAGIGGAVIITEFG